MQALIGMFSQLVRLPVYHLMMTTTATKLMTEPIILPFEHV